MSWRTVVITKRAKLDLKTGYLVVRCEDDVKKVHLDEIAVLIIENTAVSITGCLIAALSEKKIKVIFCDAKRDPSCELVSYYMLISEKLKRTKLFVTVNMRSFISDKKIEQLFKSIVLHKINLICIENKEYPRLDTEKVIIIDEDMCVI